MMTIMFNRARIGAAVMLMSAMSGCSGLGSVGNVLGSVLGQGGQGGQGEVSGYIQGVDTRNRQIGIQQQNGQSVAVSYDNQTQVVYNNQNYSVTSLENGDQVTARLQQLQNGGYYTDLVQVNQSVSANRGGTVYNGGSGQVQSFQGTVRQVDQGNGLFAVDVYNSGTVTVALPQNLGRADYQRFQNLRNGDQVRFYGVYVNNQRVELRQFY